MPELDLSQQPPPDDEVVFYLSASAYADSLYTVPVENLSTGEPVDPDQWFMDLTLAAIDSESNVEAFEILQKVARLAGINKVPDSTTAQRWLHLATETRARQLDDAIGDRLELTTGDSKRILAIELDREDLEDFDGWIANHVETQRQRMNWLSSDTLRLAETNLTVDLSDVASARLLLKATAHHDATVDHKNAGNLHVVKPFRTHDDIRVFSTALALRTISALDGTALTQTLVVPADASSRLVVSTSMEGRRLPGSVDLTPTPWDVLAMNRLFDIGIQRETFNRLSPEQAAA